jgi:hypothetical protein
VLELEQRDLAAHALHHRHQAALLGFLRRVRELRDHDRGQDAQDDHDDQDLDQRKALAVSRSHWTVPCAVAR